VALSAQNAAELLRAAHHHGQPHVAEMTTSVVLDGPAVDIAAALQQLTSDDQRAVFLTLLNGGSPQLQSAIDGLGAHVEAGSGTDPVLTLLQGYPRGQHRQLIDALCRNGLDRYAEALSAFTRATPGSIDQIASAVLQLAAAGDNTEAEQLLLETLPTRSPLELRDLILTLHRRRSPTEIGMVLTTIRTTCGPAVVTNVSAMLQRADLPELRREADRLTARW
jgi:hypothetical protein